MNRIKLHNVEDVEKMKESDKFKFSILLSKMINNIRANHRQFLRIEVDENPANLVDRIETVFHHGALIYESIKTLLNNSGGLSSIEYWKNDSDVKYIKNQRSSKSSFCNKYLSVVRNQMIYHYDFEIMSNSVKDFELGINHDIAQAASEKSIDLVYTLVEEIQLSLLLNIITEKETDEDKWGFFQEALFDLSDKLISILNNLVIEILKDNVAIEES